MKSGQCQDCKPHFYFFRLLVRWLLLYFLLCYFFPFASPFFKYNLHVFLSRVRFKVSFKKKLLGKIPDASFLHSSEKF